MKVSGFVNVEMNEYKEMTLRWRECFVRRLVELSIASVIFLISLLIPYLFFDVTLSLLGWIFFILSFGSAWAGVLYESFHEGPDITINLSGILIANKCIKWEKIKGVNIDHPGYSDAIVYEVLLKNGSVHEFRYSSLSLKKSSLMIDNTIRKLSGNRVIPRAGSLLRYINYPISKCAISLFCKELSCTEKS